MWTHVRTAYAAPSAACTSQNGFGISYCCSRLDLLQLFVIRDMRARDSLSYFEPGGQRNAKQGNAKQRQAKQRKGKAKQFKL